MLKNKLPFPFNHYTGSDEGKLKEIDNKYHGHKYLLTLQLVKNEIDEIIDFCLNSQIVSPNIRDHLQAKKKILLDAKNDFTKKLQKGELNHEKYLEEVKKVKALNMKVFEESKKNKLTQETERIKSRLEILEKEENRCKPNKNGDIEEAESKPEEQKVNLLESLKMIKVQREEVDLVDRMNYLSPREILELLKKRQKQYVNLKTYICNNIINWDGTEAGQKKKEYLVKSVLPLIEEASQLIETFKENDNLSRIMSFLKKEMVDLTPAMLHGMSLTERSEELNKLSKEVKKCLREETDYIEKLKASFSDASQTNNIPLTRAVHKKISEGEKRIIKYNQEMEYLDKLSSDVYKWVPTPIIHFVKEGRMVELLNKDIEEGSILIRFRGLENLTHRKYWIRWHIETTKGIETFTTPFCDPHRLQFDYRHTVKMSNRNTLDMSIERIEIRIEILYKKYIQGRITFYGLLDSGSRRKKQKR